MEMQYRLPARLVLMNAGAPDMELSDPRLDELSAILKELGEVALALRRMEMLRRATPEESGFVTDREKFDAD